MIHGAASMSSSPPSEASATCQGPCTYVPFQISGPPWGSAHA